MSGLYFLFPMEFTVGMQSIVTRAEKRSGSKEALVFSTQNGQKSKIPCLPIGEQGIFMLLQCEKY